MVMKSTKKIKLKQHFLKSLFFGRLYFQKHDNCVLYTRSKVISSMLFSQATKTPLSGKSCMLQFSHLLRNIYFFRRISNINSVHEKLLMNYFSGTTPLAAEEIKLSFKSGLTT